MADVYDDVAKELAAQEREFFPVDLNVNASKYALWRRKVENLFRFMHEYGVFSANVAVAISYQW